MTNSALNILKINSSSRTNDSVSRRLTDRVEARLIEQHPGSASVSRNVTDGLPAISEDWVGANFTPPHERSAEQQDLLKLSDELIAELRAADVLLIGLPIYNFGVPSALKAWIDLICRAGETFSYSESGPVGLLANKRAIISVASGGVPVGSDMDHATKFLTQVLGFVGITDVTYVSATGLAQEDPAVVLQAAEADIDALDLKIAA